MGQPADEFEDELDEDERDSKYEDLSVKIISSIYDDEIKKRDSVLENRIYNNVWITPLLWQKSAD